MLLCNKSSGLFYFSFLAAAKMRTVGNYFTCFTIVGRFLTNIIFFLFIFLICNLIYLTFRLDSYCIKKYIPKNVFWNCFRKGGYFKQCIYVFIYSRAAVVVATADGGARMRARERKRERHTPHGNVYCNSRRLKGRRLTGPQ